VHRCFPVSVAEGQHFTHDANGQSAELIGIARNSGWSISERRKIEKPERRKVQVGFETFNLGEPL
jgi:hypothetical protein